MPGLEGMDQYPGHLEAQISLHLIFSCEGYINNIVYAEKIRISSTCKKGSHQPLKL